jgi:hypothetical protein
VRHELELPDELKITGAILEAPVIVDEWRVSFAPPTPAS